MSRKNGVSRLWIGLGILAGVAIAYLADPERGGARRQAAMQQLSGAAQAAAERTTRWRNAVSARFPGQSREQFPEQIDLPVGSASASMQNPED